MQVLVRTPGAIQLVQLLDKQGLHFVSVPNAVAINVMHHEECFRVKLLLVHVILFLPYFFQLLFRTGMVKRLVVLDRFFLLLNFVQILFLLCLIHTFYLLMFVEFLLHFIFLEFLFTFLISGL